MLWRLIKALIVLAILGGLGFLAYAFVGPIFFPGDFAAPSATVTEQITLEGN